MALRYLYRKVPDEERKCEYCGKVIKRNIALYKGRYYHYGCLQLAREKRYRCTRCGAILSWLEIGEADVLGKTVRGCPYCGGKVRRIKR